MIKYEFIEGVGGVGRVSERMKWLTMLGGSRENDPYLVSEKDGQTEEGDILFVPEKTENEKKK